MQNKLKSMVWLIVITSIFIVVGCSSSPSDEQMKQLNDLKAEVNALQRQVNDKQAEKAALDKALAEKSAKLQQCQADQKAVNTALGK